MCPECYSEFSRVTPLNNPEDCLRSHRQYICQTCGRYICAAIDEKGKYRAGFPFKSLEIAKLYLRSAEVIKEEPCGIYALANKKGKDRKMYKIFADKQELDGYLKKNPNKKAASDSPMFETETYIKCSNRQLRKLADREIKIYLKEREEQSGKWPTLI